MKLTTWQATIQDDDTGAAIVSPVVTVRLGGPAGAIADLYDLAGAPVSNPITGDLDGFVQFQVRPGRYWIQAADGGTFSNAWYNDVMPEEGLSWETRSELVEDVTAGMNLPDGAVVSDGVSQYVASAGATAIADLPGWLPFGQHSLQHWGVVYDDRSAAAANGAAINFALNYCWMHGESLYLGAGVIFNSVPIIQSGAVHVFGAGISNWQKQYASDFAPQAPTAIVMTGTGSKDQTLFGVSSGQAWGAARTNPSSRTGYNDSTYLLSSFVQSSSLATGRALINFSVAWKISEQAAYGSRLQGFRIMPDAGGTDGMDDVRSSDRTVTKALSAGEWDVGVWVQGVRDLEMDQVQSVGQWRMRKGLLMTPHQKTFADGATLFNNICKSCTFSGVSIRSVDNAPVVATTATTVDVPWADDHPFGADGDLRLILTTGGRSGDSFTYTGMTKVTGGSYDILRFTGVSPDPTASAYKNCMPFYVGGGSSHLVFNHCDLQGFGHGSLEPSENEDLGGTGDNVFSSPMANLEISGNELTEISFPESNINGYETVAAHLHDCRNIDFPTYWEMNNGGRIIASPVRASNPYTIDPSVPAATETLDVLFSPHGSTINDGSLDMRPHISELEDPPLFNDPSDDGFFEPVKLRSNRFGGVKMLERGAYYGAANSDSEVALGKWIGPVNFFTGEADSSSFDRYLYSQAGEAFLRARYDIRSNTAGQASLGGDNGQFNQVWTFNHASRRFESVPDDTVVSFTPVTTGGTLKIYVYNGSTTPLNNYHGEIYFDVGGSPICAKQPGSGVGGSLDTSTSALSGTTGADGNITVSAQGGVLQIENRAGGDREIRVVLLG